MAESKRNKRTEKDIATRKRLWPKVRSDRIWRWKEKKGYVNIPRTMPYFFKIMNDCSKSKPLSSTYFALWCRLYNESGLIKIKDQNTVAYESGFSGQRAIATWRTRMKNLEKLGFIMTEPLGPNKIGYILLLNPYDVVKDLKKRKEFTDEGLYSALHERAEEIRADDMDENAEDK